MSPSMTPWCKRCPMGHSSLRTRVVKDHYVCDTCGTYYAGDPIDIRETDTFPLPPSEYEVVGQYGGVA